MEGIYSQVLATQLIFKYKFKDKKTQLNILVNFFLNKIFPSDIDIIKLKLIQYNIRLSATTHNLNELI